MILPRVSSWAAGVPGLGVGQQGDGDGFVPLDGLGLGEEPLGPGDEVPSRGGTSHLQAALTEDPGDDGLGSPPAGG